MTGTVELHGLEFHAYHGVYPHERSAGNKFSVDVIVETSFSDEAFHDDLTGTINYEALYSIVKIEMTKPAQLLEKVAHEIAHNILESFAMAISATIMIAKYNPPIGGVCKQALVKLKIAR